MPGFRRAQLRGSDELFRSTEPASVVAVEDNPELPLAATAPQPVPNAPDPGSRTVRLTAEELELLAEALQHLKFPAKQPARPSVDEFERLEELRAKLLGNV